MTGRKVTDSEAIRVETVSKIFGTGAEVVRALDDVSLEPSVGHIALHGLRPYRRPVNTVFQNCAMADPLAVMNEGCILQIGTPDQIYERPSTRFVADFIGDSNFLKTDERTEGVS